MESDLHIFHCMPSLSVCGKFVEKLNSGGVGVHVQWTDPGNPADTSVTPTNSPDCSTTATIPAGDSDVTPVCFSPPLRICEHMAFDSDKKLL